MPSEPVPMSPQAGARTEERRLHAVHPVHRAAARAAKPGRQVDPLSPYVLGIDKLQKRPQGREPRTLQALKVIRDLDPTAAQAIWNFLRLTGQGFDMKAVRYDDKGLEIDERGSAQQFLDELMHRVGAEYGGGGDQFHGVLTLSLITSGALAMEIAPTDDLADVQDWYAIDPSKLSFQRDEDDNLILGYYPAGEPGKFVVLPMEQVFYDPLDPDVEDPYGRPPMLSAIGAIMAKAQLINDLRAVVHQAGYPRLDLEVDTEYVMNAAPNALKEPNRQDELTAWIDEQVRQIVSQFEALNVDDTFVHLDFVKVNNIGAGQTMDFEKIDDILTRSLNSALKTLPIMLGFNESTSEGHGSIQWQIQVAGVMALRRRVKRAMERAADISLRLAGHSAHAKATYDEIRVVDRLYEKQADLFEAKTNAFHVSQNWRTNDEAANIITGHDSYGEPKLLADSTSTVPGEGPQAPTGQDQGKQQQSPEWALLFDDERAAPASSTSSPARSRSYKDEHVEKYATEGGAIFVALVDEAVALLKAEGELRDVPKDIADYIFGRSFSREMKRLIRDAMAEGIFDAEIDFALAINETNVDRIWEANRFYVAKVRDEFKTTLRSGEIKTLEDVRAWFKRNQWREELMGRHLAKQAYSAGFAQARSEAGDRFIWELGGSNHCGSCLARGGGEYSYHELLSLGMPGSGSLECGGNCHCSLIPVQASGVEPRQTALVVDREPDVVTPALLELLSKVYDRGDESYREFLSALSQMRESSSATSDARWVDLMERFSAVAERPIEVTTNIDPGAVQVTVQSDAPERKLLKRESKFTTDDRGVIVGKEEVEEWQ